MHGHGSVNISMQEVFEMQMGCRFASSLLHEQALTFTRLGMKAEACCKERKSREYEALAQKSFSPDYMSCNPHYTKRQLVHMTALVKRLIHADDVMAKTEGPNLHKTRDEFDSVKEKLREMINIHPRGGKLNK